mmetsp:Transcript_41365/g.92906  ORF Transcript_41365/g.92906 Transcript_41365/m.92906 type:complete len:208 (+) Transcript_41365:62-685(+)
MDLAATGRSGREMPAEYGEVGPYYRKTAEVIGFAGVTSIAAVFIQTERLWRAAATLGAAYAFGSNLWLMYYGPRMLKLCAAHHEWLGKEAHAVIQASNFPAFFALQVAGTFIAAVGRALTTGADVAFAAAGAAVLLGTLNLAVLGPATAPLMYNMYGAKSTGTSLQEPMLAEDFQKAKKKFGMVHGISMLADLLALFCIGSYLALVA